MLLFFFVGKTYSIDNFEMTNVFIILDYLSTNINVIKKHRNVKSNGT